MRCTPSRSQQLLKTNVTAFRADRLSTAASVGPAAVLGGPYAWDTISSWLGAEPGAGGADGAAWPLLSGACCAPRMCSRNLHPSTKRPSVPMGQPNSHVQPTACRSMLGCCSYPWNIQPGATDAACRRKVTCSTDARMCRRRLLGSTA